MEEFKRTDKDHVWIDGKQYISLSRVGEMLQEATTPQKVTDISVKLSVDTSEIDRVSIGMRLYDMLSMCSPRRRLKMDDGQLSLTEKDINDMFHLVNDCDRDVVVYRGDGYRHE